MRTEKEIQNYIDDKVEENIHLDYKAAEALAKTDLKKKEISKDVSAFANSDGGVIIYGVKEFPKDKKFLPEKIDPIKRTDFSKETLEQIINSNISPKISNVIITPITIGKEENDEVIYVVEIPKSDTAHQANDKRYYKRYNFQSEPMDDWEIKDIINRKSKSEIVIWLEPKSNIRLFEEQITKEGIELEFDIWIKNIGNKVAEYIDIYFIGKVEDAHLFSEPKPIKYDDSFEISYNNQVEHTVTIQDNDFIVNIQRIPLLPKISKHFGELIVFSNYFIQGKDIEIVVSTEDNRTKKSKKMINLVHY